MSTHPLANLLPPSHRKARAPLVVTGAFALARARVHEFCGPSRRILALLAARATEGPIIWIRPARTPERLHPEGVQQIVEPGRLIFVTLQRPEDLLWSCEEALRAGVAPVVIADLPNPPALTPVRRLHLAAETGAAEGQVAPVGILLTPGDGGAQGAETRWHIAPRHRVDATAWQLSLRRSRDMPPAEWTLSSHRSKGVAEFTLARASVSTGMDKTAPGVTFSDAT